MGSKPNISVNKLRPWDDYKQKRPEEAAATIYGQVSETAEMICAWYWASIKTKRRTSLVVRGLGFAGLVVGTLLPILAALKKDDATKLLFTQWGVGLLAIAGLLIAADRIFGWSSGWMRYITTVTTMENLTRAFQLEWGRVLLAQTAPLDESDAKGLFELGAALENELIKLQAEETTKWCAEFNTGISLLETMIKTQREETDKKLDAIRTSLSDQGKAATEQQKAKLPGAIEATFSYKGEAKSVLISLDEEQPAEFLGIAWSRARIEPGIHILRVRTVEDPPVTIERTVEVGPAAVSRIDIKLS